LFTAFQFAEKGKASVLLSAIKGGDAIKFSGIPENLQLMEKDLNDRMNGYESLVYNEKNKRTPDSSKITLWELKLFNLNQQHDSLINQFETKYESYYELKHNTEVISVNNIQSHLDENKVLIEYVLTDSLLFCFAISKEKLVFNKCKVDSAFYNDLAALRLLHNINFSNHNFDTFKGFVLASNRLYNMLFMDLKDIIKNKNLIVVPDGKLGYLPFESLITELPDFSSIDYKNLSYLLINNPISYTYSSTLLFRENVKKSNGQSLLAFAPNYNNSLKNNNSNNRSFSIDNNLSPLPYAQEEVSNINSIFKGSVYRGEQADETRFKNSVSEFNIIHLAMHTVIDDKNPMQSKMIFKPNNDTIDDGYLNTYEIYELELQAQMVVLSACNTGSGKINRGEGIMSLARGFIYAGVPSIVMTLWNVDDKSGANIMTLFYENLNKGMSKDIALQQAKLTYLNNSSPLHSHPYFWAAYVDIGDTEPITKSFLSSCGIYFYISILLFAFWFVRYKRKKRVSTI